jgi:hypothetical protein
MARWLVNQSDALRFNRKKRTVQKSPNAGTPNFKYSLSMSGENISHRVNVEMKKIPKNGTISNNQPQNMCRQKLMLPSADVASARSRKYLNSKALAYQGEQHVYG